MIKSLIDTINQYEFIDGILITGDLTSYATPYEFAQLYERIEYIKKSIKGFNGHVIFAMGNHDSNWDISNISIDSKYNDFDSEYFLSRSSSIHADFEFINSFSAPGPVINSGVITTSKANIIVLNSGLYSSKDQKYKHGKVGKLQLDWLQTIDNLEDDKVNILMLHHHLFKYTYPEYFEDISNVEEGSEIEDIISNLGIDLVVHGHRHHPLFFSYNRSGCKRPFNILCAGSLSVATSHRMHGQIQNMFHVVEIYDRDSITRSVLGKIDNYKFSSMKGWMKNTANEFVSLDDVVHFGRISSNEERKVIVQGYFRILETMDANLYTLPEYANLPLELKCIAYQKINELISTVSEERKIAVRGSYPGLVTLIKE
jgi:3',5'-cyclic AMP phosphodiesterase CpdA